MNNKDLLTEATMKALQEDEYTDYVENEEALAKDYCERVTNNITTKTIENFNKLKEILATRDGIVECEGYYFPELAINILENTNRRHNLNGFMDLTISDILNMVEDFDTPELAIKELFKDYKPDSALAWADNFVTILDKLDFEVEETDYEDEEDY